MVNYKKLKNGIVVFKQKTKHKDYDMFRYYKAKQNKNKVFKKLAITKKEYELLNKRLAL